MILHLPSRLVARLHAVDGFTGGTLQTEDQRANHQTQQLQAGGPLCPRLVHVNKSTALESGFFSETSFIPAVLVAVIVHGQQTLEVVLVSTLRQPSHRLSPGHWSHTRTLVPGGTSQGLHADGAILAHTTQQRTSYFLCFY